MQEKRCGDRAKRPLESRTPRPKVMMREVRGKGGGCSSWVVRVQLTESVGVDVGDKFSWF